MNDPSDEPSHVPATKRRPRHGRREVVLWLLLALLVFVGFLGRNPALSTHEARVAQTAAAMSRSGWPWDATPVAIPQVELRTGSDGSQLRERDDGATWTVNPWLVPVFEGQIRLQKPPLPYWTTAILFRLFGEGAGIARLVPALLGVITAALVYALGREVTNRRTAGIALAVFVSSYFVIDEFRKAMADPYLACLTLAATFAWVRASSSEAGRSSWLLLFYGVLALASLAKGPVAFLHVGVAIAAFMFALRRRPRVGIGWHALGMLFYLAIALPWPVYIVTHLPTALEIWRYESIGEFVDNQRNARPFFYYLPGLLLIAAPWTAGWIASGIDLVQRRARPGMRRRGFAWIWLLVVVAIFSCSHMKKNAYLLPVVPAIAIASAQPIVRTLAVARRRPPDVKIGWTATAHWIAGIVFAGVIAVSGFKEIGGATAVIVAIASVLIALLPLRNLLRREFTRWFRWQAIAFALLILAFLAFPQAAHRSRKRTTADEAAAPSALMDVAWLDNGVAH